MKLFRSIWDRSFRPQAVIKGRCDLSLQIRPSSLGLAKLVLENKQYHDLVVNPINAWLVTSPGIRRLVGLLEAARFLPAGFRRFNDTFLAGTVAALIAMGRLGILTGSSVIVLRKPSVH